MQAYEYQDSYEYRRMCERVRKTGEGQMRCFETLCGKGVPVLHRLPGSCTEPRGTAERQCTDGVKTSERPCIRAAAAAGKLGVGLQTGGLGTTGTAHTPVLG